MRRPITESKRVHRPIDAPIALAVCCGAVHRVTALLSGLSLWLCALHASPSRAQQPEGARPAPQALSFTVSGGVSLGAYEAGALYVLTEAAKRSEGEFDVRIATGASAGSANALISLMESCRPIQDDPAQGLGFRTWLPVGMAQLFRPAQVSAISVLTREPLERALERLEHAFTAGLRADCDVVLGVSATREVATHAVLSNRAAEAALEIPRQIERFVLRTRGRGPGRAPRIDNYVDPRARLPQPLLPLEAGDDDAAQTRNFRRLAELLYASAAFPLAFAPYALAHCETDPNAGAQPDPRCTAPSRTRFIDGGVFDNSPLRSNHDIVQRGLRRGADGRAHWLDLREQTGAAPAASALPDVRFSYVDPATRAFPPLDVAVQEQPAASAPALSLRLWSSFVETARRHELLMLLQESSDATALGDHIGVTLNQLPTISSQLGAFLGFFERDFRKLDFYIGMYDGLSTLRGQLAATGLAPAAVDARLAAQFPVLRTPLPPDLPAAMRPFACLLSQVEPAYAGHAAACSGGGDRNFRILLQVTLDRLHTACARAEPRELPAHASAACIRAASGAARRDVPGVPPLEPEQRAPLEDEKDFAYSLRLLADYRFEYHDLGLPADDAAYGAVRIRRRLLAMSSALAAAQPSAADRLLVQTAARAAVNEIAYEPPRNWLYATAGTAVELGASVMPLPWNQSWARVNVALQVSHWDTIATPKHLALAFSPLIGPELQLLFLSSAALQTMLGARVGYQASVTDGAGFGACGDAQAYGDARNCSQLVVQGYVAAAIIERLRAQLVVETFPTRQDAPFDSRIDLQLTFGLQFF
jgi:hypothetical protein